MFLREWESGGDYSAAVSRYCLIALAASSWAFCNTSLTMQASKLGACESSNSARLMRCWMTSCESVPRFSSRWRRASIEGGFMKRLNARPPYIFFYVLRADDVNVADHIIAFCQLFVDLSAERSVIAVFIDFLIFQKVAL